MSRRAALVHLDSEDLDDPHAGLWLDKYISTVRRDDGGREAHGREPDRRAESRRDLVRKVAAVRQPPPYLGFFDRWRAGLRAVGARCLEAATRGRVVIGLGDETVLETAISLHHVYGVPYIPGSALKGLAAHYADRSSEAPAWRKGGNAHRIAFGTTISAGHVVFFDALPFPGRYGLHPDVMTVHHPDYYSEKQGQSGDLLPPADWDSPNPVPFLSASGIFLVALAGPEAWLDSLADILRLALDREGVGAKTSSGYGRLSLTAGPAATEPRVDSVAEALATRVRNMAAHRVRGEIDAIGRQWSDLTGEGRRQVAAAVLELLQRSGMLSDRKWRKSRPWIVEMEESGRDDSHI